MGVAWIGLLAVVMASFSSGFAGCYFEKIIKTSESSIWIRNIQLGLFSLLFSVIGMIASDSFLILEFGFFKGYSTLVWMVVVNQALGGLLVAMVVKYADNILKGFSTSLSILVSCVVDFVVFGFVPSRVFLIGASV
ncbi:hypothetical protein HK096_007904, partial [Nowakowskiella sp. JEL0078]